MSQYQDQVSRSLTLKEIDAVRQVMRHMADVDSSEVQSAVIAVSDGGSGTAAAVVFWDAENETWLADFEMSARVRES